MSIRPGSSVTSPRSMTSAESGSGHRDSPRDAVAVDDDDRGRANLAGLDIGPAVGAVRTVGTGHGTGSDTQSSVEAPESGTRGCFQHSTGKDTMIIE